MLETTYNIFLRTLCNKNRLAVIDLLRKGPKNVTQIYEELKLDQTTVSHCLVRLRRCGFVTVEQKGIERFYSLNKDTIEPLMKLMNMHIKKYCCKLV